VSGRFGSWYWLCSTGYKRMFLQLITYWPCHTRCIAVLLKGPLIFASKCSRGNGLNFTMSGILWTRDPEIEKKLRAFGGQDKGSRIQRRNHVSRSGLPKEPSDTSTSCRATWNDYNRKPSRHRSDRRNHDNKKQRTLVLPSTPQHFLSEKRNFVISTLAIPSLTLNKKS
jgi:hypothetical protein